MGGYCPRAVADNWFYPRLNFDVRTGAANLLCQPLAAPDWCITGALVAVAGVPYTTQRTPLAFVDNLHIAGVFNSKA